MQPFQSLYLTVLLSIPFNKLPWRKVVTLSPRLFWTRLDLQLYPFLFTLSFVHVTHCYPLLMTVLSLKYNFESIQDLYIRLTKIHTFYFSSFVLLKLSKELDLNKAITTYLRKQESWDSIQRNERHVIVILLTRHLNTKYQLIIQALF